MITILSRPRQSALSEAITRNDLLFLGAAFVSLFFSIYLWFSGAKDQGIFVGLWVPSIIGLGVYFRLILDRVRP